MCYFLATTWQRHTFTYLNVIFLFNSSSFFIQVSLLHTSSEDSLPGRAPSSSGLPLKKITKSPDTFTHFLRLFAFHMDGQLHFTGIILDGNILIIPVNCQRSTLSSIISDSFEFLLAASMHKFHKKIEKQHRFFFSPLSLVSNKNMDEIKGKEVYEIALFVSIYLSQ